MNENTIELTPVSTATDVTLPNILLNAPDVLTVKEAAKLLKLSNTTMYRLIRQGIIMQVRVGKKILIPRIYLQAFIEKEAIKCYGLNQMVGKLPCCKEGVSENDNNRVFAS